MPPFLLFPDKPGNNATMRVCMQTQTERRRRRLVGVYVRASAGIFVEIWQRSKSGIFSVARQRRQGEVLLFIAE